MKSTPDSGFSGRNALPSMDILEPRLLLSTVPLILDAQINGSTVDPGGVINVVMGLDDTFNFNVQAVNDGDHAWPGYGLIHVSFPHLGTGADALDRITQVLPGDNLHYAETASNIDPALLYNGALNDGQSDWPMVIATDTDGWLQGELNALFLTIQPEAFGHFGLLFGAGMSSDNDSVVGWNWAPQLFTNDLGLPCDGFTVNVISPYAAHLTDAKYSIVEDEDGDGNAEYIWLTVNADVDAGGAGEYYMKVFADGQLLLETDAETVAGPSQLALAMGLGLTGTGLPEGDYDLTVELYRADDDTLIDRLYASNDPDLAAVPLEPGTLRPNTVTLWPTVELNKGSLNGFEIDLDNPEITVFPGQAIDGYLQLSASIGWDTGLDFPVIGAWTWGQHDAAGISIASNVPVSEGKTLRWEVSLRAPSAPGTYYLIYGGTWANEAGNLLSGDEPTTWNDGDDLLDTPADDLENSLDTGRVITPGDFDLAGGVVRIQVSTQLQFGDEGPKSVIYTESDGTKVTVSLKKGTGQLEFMGDGLELYSAGKKMIVLGNIKRVSTISLLETTVKSNLLVRTDKGGDGLADIGKIVGDQPMGKLQGKTVDLVGQGIRLTGAGYIGSIQLHDISEGAHIDMPGVAAKGVSIRFNKGQPEMDLASPLKKLTAIEWDGGSLTAPWAGKITIRGNRKAGIAGNLGADMNFNDVGKRGRSLSKLLVAGTAVGAQLRTIGDIGSVAFGAAEMFDILAGCDAGLLRHADAVGDFIDLDVKIGSVTIRGLKIPRGQVAPRFFTSSNISAASIGKVKLLNAGFANDETEFGLFASKANEDTGIGSVKYRDTVDDQKWSWPFHEDQVYSTSDLTISLL